MTHSHINRMNQLFRLCETRLAEGCVRRASYSGMRNCGNLGFGSYQRRRDWRSSSKSRAREMELTRVVEGYPGSSKPVLQIMREEAMSRTIACSVRMIGFAAILAAPVAWAQEAPPVRVRGTIEGIIDSAVYVVKTRDGAELKVTLPEKPQIAGIVKASLSDIKEGSFVGVTAMPKPDGSLSALEVHIFPEAMRGTGEGHYPWDLRPQSTMTNANIEQIVAAVDGRTLTLKYKDGEKKIFVPAEAPIVAYVPGDKSDLKPGAKVLIIAAKQPDGTLQGRAWRVGRDGLTPPM